MKTRNELYSKEATELLRIITTYKTLAYEQLLRLYPGREAKIRKILTGFERHGRLTFDRGTGIVLSADMRGETPDTSIIEAFWVLLEFLDRAEYHTTSDFPVQISFFADAEMYEIVRVHIGQEALVTHALKMRGSDDLPRRIIIVDAPEQVPALDIPNTAGFCTVARDGEVEYYRKG